MSTPDSEMHLTVPQARAITDAYRAALATLRNAPVVWSSGEYEHHALLITALARIACDALVIEAKRRGLDHDAAIADARKVLEDHLTAVEMAMLDAGVMITPSDDIPVTTEGPDD